MSGVDEGVIDLDDRLVMPRTNQDSATPSRENGKEGKRMRLGVEEKEEQKQLTSLQLWRKISPCTTVSRTHPATTNSAVSASSQMDFGGKGSMPWVFECSPVCRRKSVRGELREMDERLFVSFLV